MAELRRSACAGFTSIARMLAARWPNRCRRGARRPKPWCSPCRGAGYQSPTRSRPHSDCRSTCWWCASSACRPSPSLRWVPLRAAAQSCSTATSCATCKAATTRSSRYVPGRLRNCCDASGNIAATSHRSRCRAGQPSSLTTAWPPARPWKPRSVPCLGRGTRTCCDCRRRGRVPLRAGVLQRCRAMVPGLRPNLGRGGARSAGTRACYARNTSRTRRR